MSLPPPATEQQRLRLVVATGERHFGGVVEEITRQHQVVAVLVPAGALMDQQLDHWRFRRERRKSRDLTGTCRRLGILMRSERELSDGAMTSFLRQRHADALLIMSWPSMIRESTCRIFPLGAMNIHPSMLPELRGADPVFNAIDQGLPRVGVSFHKVTPELDAGPLIYQRPITVMPHDTYDKLYIRVRKLIRSSVNQALSRLLAQPDGRAQIGEASYGVPFKAGMRILDVSSDANQTERRCRACYSHHPMVAACAGHLFTYSAVAVLKRAVEQERQGTILAVSRRSILLRIGRHIARLGGILSLEQQSSRLDLQVGRALEDRALTQSLYTQWLDQARMEPATQE